MNRFNVFFDRGTPPSLARMLDGFLSGEYPRPRVVHMLDIFPDDARTSDEEWMAWVGDQSGRWIAISNDQRILRVRAERQALERNIGRLVVAPRGFLELPKHERAALLIWHWKVIEETFFNLDPPFTLRLPTNRKSKPSPVR